jgi:hypothetical protein
MKIQKVQNTALRKILGAFRSAPVKAMQRDAEILPVNIRMKEIRDRFAVQKTLCGNSQTAASQQRETLKGCLLESSKWKVLMVTSIGASVHHGSNQSMIAIRNLTKPCKS